MRTGYSHFVPAVVVFASASAISACSSADNEAQNTEKSFSVAKTRFELAPEKNELNTLAFPYVNFDTKLDVLSFLRSDLFANLSSLALPPRTEAKLPGKHSVFRSYTGSYHFFSLDPNEGTKAGFKFEGSPFELFDYALRGMVPILRCYDPASARHFLSLKPDCGAASLSALTKAEGTMGYLWATPRPDTKPLFQCYLPEKNAALTTTDSSECTSNNYQVSLTLGYL